MSGTSMPSRSTWPPRARAPCVSACHCGGGATAAAGAFTFTGTATNDSALVATLSPGTYTAQVVGVGGTVGIALLAVYALP